MTELASHIAYLLRHHDCVVMAGIGAFVAVSDAATFSADGMTAMPPRREIRFNSAIKSDDGLLNWSVSRKRSVSFEQATAIVSQMLTDAANRLRIEGTLTFNHVGSLRQERDGRITFLPAPESIITLPEIRLKKVESTPLLKLEIEHKTPERSVAIVKVPLRRRFIGAAAAAAILLGLGFVLTTPISMPTAHEASLGLPELTQPTKVEPVSAPADLVLQMAIPSGESIMQVQPKPQPVATETGSARYVLVVASLPSRQLAEKFIAEAADSKLQILEKDGKFRVYITAGATQDEVAANARAIEGLSASYPDAWVCRK